MNIGLLLPGFSANDSDWAIPVQAHLVRQLAQQHTVRVLALRYPHHRQPYHAFGAKVIPLGARQRRGLNRLALWATALQTLRRFHQQQPFDVLHAAWGDESGLLAAWAGRWLNIPAIVSLSGGELVRLDDIGYGLQRSAFSRWIVGQALRADCIVSPCEYTQNLIAATGYAVPLARQRLIPLGVDTNLFTPSKEPAAEPRLIHAASLIGIKDQVTLLRAVALLKQPIHLDIIGEGSHRAALETLTSQLSLSGRVHFLGAVQHLDMPAHFQRASLHVLTSRHEGFGMVTLEAAACGLPTVSTAVGLMANAPELGLSVPVGDAPALAHALDTLISNSEQRRTLAQSARQAIASRYTIQHTAHAYTDLYASLHK